MNPASPDQGNGKKKAAAAVGVAALAASPVGMGMVAFATTTALMMGGGSADGAVDPCQASTVAVGSGNVDTSMKYLMSRGLSGAQAAGIVGNLQVESGPSVDPHAKNSLGFQGIAQWDPGQRWPLLEKFATQVKADKWAVATQLRYLGWELGLNSDYPGKSSPYQSVLDKLHATSDASDAAQVIFTYYEAPGDTSLPKRQKNAEAIATKYQDSGSSTTTVSSSSSASPSTGHHRHHGVWCRDR